MSSVSSVTDVGIDCPELVAFLLCQSEEGHQLLLGVCVASRTVSDIVGQHHQLPWQLAALGVEPVEHGAAPVPVSVDVVVHVPLQVPPEHARAFTVQSLGQLYPVT